MAEWEQATEDIVYRGRIKVPYQWWIGETGSHFFIKLRDEKKLLGRYCAQCNLVFMPPRQACPRCFNKEMAWRELKDEGTLVSFAVPAYTSELHPLEPPFAYGIIKLDGADTGLTHLVAGFKEGRLKTGLRVKAVFKEDRTGDIMDIRYFQPV